MNNQDKYNNDFIEAYTEEDFNDKLKQILKTPKKDLASSPLLNKAFVKRLKNANRLNEGLAEIRSFITRFFEGEVECRAYLNSCVVKPNRQGIDEKIKKKLWKIV